MSIPIVVKDKNISHTELWAFTVKTLGTAKTVDEKDYEPFFKVLYKLSEVVTLCGEVDSKGVLHYHGVIRLDSNFYRKNLRVEGYHLYLKRIYNLLKWMNYIFKNDADKRWDSVCKSLF